MELLFLLMFIIAGRCQQMKDVMQMLLKHFTIRPPDEPRNANVTDTFTIRPPDETCNENVTDTFTIRPPDETCNENVTDTFHCWAARWNM